MVRVRVKVRVRVGVRVRVRVSVRVRIRVRGLGIELGLGFVSGLFNSTKLNNRTSHDHQILFEVARNTRSKHLLCFLPR